MIPPDGRLIDIKLKKPYKVHCCHKSIEMEYTIQQRVFIVKNYWISNSVITTQRAFRREYGVRDGPDRKTILRLVDKIEQTGSLISEKGKHNPQSLVPQRSVDVRERLLRSPHKSLRRLSQETGYSLTMCQRAAKHAKLRQYRMTAVHELKEPDKIKRVRYCNWLLHVVERDPDILKVTWFTDEAWFHLSGYVNSQNTRVWASENPHVFHESPLHSEKVGVWCAISGERIIGPIFFEETVNTVAYKNIFTDFVNQLDDMELTQGYFQQDGATCHTSNESMAFISSFFEDRVISKGLWPPRSPDLTTPDYFLWGYLKSRVYRNRPQTKDDLRRNITAEINNIDIDMLRRVSNNMVKRATMCLQEEGGHFQHLL